MEIQIILHVILTHSLIACDVENSMLSTDGVIPHYQHITIWVKYKQSQIHQIVHTNKFIVLCSCSLLYSLLCTFSANYQVSASREREAQTCVNDCENQ